MSAVTEPTRSTMAFLRAKAGTTAKLRQYLKGISRKQKREAIERASVRPSMPISDLRGGRE